MAWSKALPHKTQLFLPVYTPSLNIDLFVCRWLSSSSLHRHHPRCLLLLICVARLGAGDFRAIKSWRSGSQWSSWWRTGAVRRIEIEIVARLGDPGWMGRSRGKPARVLWRWHFAFCAPDPDPSPDPHWMRNVVMIPLTCCHDCT